MRTWHACIRTYIFTHMHITYVYITACIWTCTHKCMYACMPLFSMFSTRQIVLYTIERKIMAG